MALLLFCMSPAVNAENLPAITHEDQLQSEIQTTQHGKGPDYRPRTQHLDKNGQPKYTNRLILEASPYLLQHAHNPVDWYPWGPEAFEKARNENKPVFLSIGYSTCHWCHVMERESFDNIDIATFMNRHFVSIIVDRERHPDIDMTYMTAVKLLNGSSGWPMNSFLTPQGQLFFGGTYYPPDQFLDLLKRMEQAWREQQEIILNRAHLISNKVQDYLGTKNKRVAIDRSIFDMALRQIHARYDSFKGGFDHAPKFPNESILFFLFDMAVRHQDEAAMKVFMHSLQQMAMGGIYDQLGGGFHRYSTDLYWLIPHFEKMLFNQANLSQLYIKAHELSGDLLYARVAQQIFDYVLHELTSPEGGFYSAMDADSEGKEGKYYIWSLDEVREILTEDEAAFAIEIFGMSETGNYEGSNVLYLPVTLGNYSEKKGMPLKQVLDELDLVRGKLLSYRNKRSSPLRDEKIIISWNSMMITALANASQVLNNKKYLDMAVNSAEFIWNNMRNEDNNLWRIYLDGEASVSASQDDYAYYSEALLILYDITDDILWQKRSRLIVEKMLDKFWDSKNHGFYITAEDRDNTIMIRPKDSNDSATPSGNSVALRVLSRLNRRTGEIIYEKYASETLSAFSSNIVKNPAAYPYMLLAANEFLYRETGDIQYAARGKVKVKKARTERRDNGHMVIFLSFNIQPGWHINSDSTLDEDLVPTHISIMENQSTWRITDIEYPEPEIKILGFSKTSLSLFEKHFNVRLSLDLNGRNPDAILNIIPLRINLQACNDEICLAPETLILNISTGNI